MAIRDIWAEAVYAASFAGIPLDVMMTNDEVRLYRAPHEVPFKDGAEFQATGAGPRQCRVKVCFFERDPDEDDAATGFATDDHLTRFSTFWQTITTQREPLEFVHPLYGAFQAWAENISAAADAENRNYIGVDVEFVEDSTSPSVLVDQSIAPYQAAVADAQALAADFDAQVQLLEMPADAVSLQLKGEVDATLTAWNDIKTTQQDVDGGLSKLSDMIDDSLNEINYATDLDRIPLFRTTVRLNGACVRAAEAFKKVAPRLANYRVAVAGPLRSFVTLIYPGGQFERRHAQMLRLNAIPDPGYIPAGTVLIYELDNPVGVTGLAGLRGKVAR